MVLKFLASKNLARRFFSYIVSQSHFSVKYRHCISISTLLESNDSGRSLHFTCSCFCLRLRILLQFPIKAEQILCRVARLSFSHSHSLGIYIYSVFVCVSPPNNRHPPVPPFVKVPFTRTRCISILLLCFNFQTQHHLTYLSGFYNIVSKFQSQTIQ